LAYISYIESDAEEYFRKKLETQDKDEVSEVMRNVREGFGRNRRAFSSGLNNGEARGRFNLNDLVAADGDKHEAARLGLLESDEELSGDESKKTSRKKRKSNASGSDNDEEVEEEMDEEELMEQQLRERYMNQPKIYITSSESESEGEEENVDRPENIDEIPSDEEREQRQMKLFSAKAKINRRMQVRELVDHTVFEYI